MGTLSNPGYTPDTRDPETDEAELLPSQGKQFRWETGRDLIVGATMSVHCLGGQAVQVGLAGGHRGQTP